jgi:hypothetical protein
VRRRIAVVIHPGGGRGNAHDHCSFRFTDRVY